MLAVTATAAAGARRATRAVVRQRAGAAASVSSTPTPTRRIRLLGSHREQRSVGAAAVGHAIRSLYLQLRSWSSSPKDNGNKETNRLGTDHFPLRLPSQKPTAKGDRVVVLGSGWAGFQLVRRALQSPVSFVIVVELSLYLTLCLFLSPGLLLAYAVSS